jgi:pyruvate dehydrogenase E2 component (dihydrolipoamide acetyltransferase)
MSVSVSMPQLGESVTEGTVTRWLKREGEHVSADEPLLEVSTDKVDTEIPSPVSGILRGITVAEDETVAVGAQLAVIDEDGAGGAQAQEAAPAAQAWSPEPQAPAPAAPYEQGAYQAPAAGYQFQQPGYAAPEPVGPDYHDSGYQFAEPAPHRYDVAQHPGQWAGQEPGYTTYQQPEYGAMPQAEPAPVAARPELAQPEPAQPEPAQPEPAWPEPAPPVPMPAEPEAPDGGYESGEGAYVTPLVRKLAAEHSIDLATLTGTGVGGRIRKQDVLEAARARRGEGAPAVSQAAQSAAAVAAPPAPPAPPAAPAQVPPSPPAPSAPPAPVQAPAAQVPAGPGAAGRPGTQADQAAAKRGSTERLSRARQVIAQRMVESLQTSAQLTTVVEADVTAIARLRDRVKASFEAREGVKLSFLPFFALAAVEALKVHPRLNAVIDTANGTVTYHDAEHLGIAVDTDRGLMVPVIRNAGDLNIGGLARKIADLASRTRSGQVGPDELSGGTFTLTNTGSRGALFDTPIINQPQVGILGTGTVNKRPVVVDDPDLGEVITVRSIVYLALTYDHRLVDGADAARFLVTIKNRLEEGAFETEFGR